MCNARLPPAINHACSGNSSTHAVVTKPCTSTAGRSGFRGANGSTSPRRKKLGAKPMTIASNIASA
jgi:hypothetical protein